MLEAHRAGKATEKRQNIDPSTPLACTEHLHLTFNGEIRRAPGCHQMQVPRWLRKTRTKENN
jgi:hypothetical protein